MQGTIFISLRDIGVGGSENDNFHLLYAWTSLYMDGTAVKFFLVICPHEAGTCDPNYTPGVDFLDQNFLSSKNSG